MHAFAAVGFLFSQTFHQALVISQGVMEVVKWNHKFPLYTSVAIFLFLFIL